ncbi:hypothetical protein ACQP3C_31215, partial [Escherichia coli]
MPYWRPSLPVDHIVPLEEEWRGKGTLAVSPFLNMSLLTMTLASQNTTSLLHFSDSSLTPSPA